MIIINCHCEKYERHSYCSAGGREDGNQETEKCMRKKYITSEEAKKRRILDQEKEDQGRESTPYTSHKGEAEEREKNTDEHENKEGSEWRVN